MSDLFVPLSADRHTGKRLGKYEVLCRLSTGGMSELFLAYHKGVAGFRKLVVLKQILPDIKADEEIVRMFIDEAQITAQFAHPNIAQVYDLDETDGELFLAMEFIPGATLIEVARACRDANEAIPTGFSLAAVRDTALALHYAHNFKDPAGRARQVIHRDVAEKNIMVTYDGTTKLLDFGIAKVAGRASRTAVGKVKGTSGYMSPEQIMGLDLDPRTDVFSLGVVLHECLTGMRLFYGRDAEEGMAAALNSAPQPPSRLNPQVSSALDGITLKALARERQQRFGSALEFARALEKTAGSQIWHPEQSAEFIQRHFADRREQTRKLLDGATFDATGELRMPRRTGEAPRAFQPDQVSDDGRVVRVGPLTAPPVARKTGSVPTPFKADADPDRTVIKPPRSKAKQGEDEEATVAAEAPDTDSISAPGNDARKGRARWLLVGVSVVAAAVLAGLGFWWRMK